MKDYNKNYTQYLLKGQFKLVFYIQDCKYSLTDMINNTTNVSWSNYLREAIDSFKKEEYHFDDIAEMDVKSLAHKRDMTYDFCLKHIISAFEWKLNAMINRDKNLINKLPKNWSHPNNTKFNKYRNN